MLSTLLSNTVLWRVLACLAMALLLWGGFSSEPIPQYTTYFDKYTHCVAFAGLTGTLLLAFPQLYRSVIVMLMLLLGFGIEVGQDMFLDRRSFDWGDFLVDGIGVVIGLIAILGLRRVA